MSRKQYFFIILILGSLATVSPFSIDMYLPGFPRIARDLGTTIDQVQLSLTSYLIGICIGQILYGPLLDRFGRKKPLYAGLALYVLASFGCALTSSADALIVMRFFQAMGGCVGLVASQALVSDLFPSDKRAEVFSLITLVIAVSPMIAPTVGGYVTASIAWQWIFIILAGIVSVIIVAIYFFLPTGREADTSVSLRPKAVMNGFATVIRQPQFLIYTLAGGLATAAPFAYIAGSSDVFMNIYKVTEQQYGWIFAFLAVAMIGSTQLNHILLKKFKSEQIIKVTLFYQSIVGILLIAGVYNNWFGLYSLIGMMFIFLTGQGLTGPNGSALSLAPFRKHTGSASALMGSWRMGAGAIISAIVSILHNNTALPMVGMMAACSLGGLVILHAGNAVVKHQASRREVEDEVSVLL
ncbi:multidrug effflux MFS transporter [Dyadobacter fanqingshengii]|uniref:Multidrug effflux MFS transporter n=1 Tax=Dyadobacter fanqingshengii TaxID=2906443 RepID=A0A9X1PBR6_9BACT|nr:multidrug effflux MFS transporter [Dyadobacter fanqingshengii]MCF0041635.1 multidrug effflux MFS transporter [Dyadobacter fanqingshengii]MCF2505139.1 multidrug effflux MFS transporter [Dyadobacter fanqingshengii]USJ36648.1 multidrug effflux MFS transporter [Dyadobacter fanqingshengii]